MSTDDMKLAVEALLFASERPLSVKDLQMAFEDAVKPSDLQAVLEALKEEYAALGRGFKLFEIADGYQIMTDPRFSPYLKRFYQEREKKKLSQAALETLAVIAYRQPVTRADIEFIRGVNVDAAIKSLTDKALIKIAGRKDVPGRPILYGTTEHFLDHFGLKSLTELPPLKTFTEKDIEENLLPPQLKAERIAGEARPAEDASVAEDDQSGEQKPIGCDNG